MKTKIIFLSVGLLIIPNVLNANVEKGKKIYMKKMKAACGFSGAKFATKHSQAEWEKIKKSGNFAKEVSKICPGLKIKDKYINDVYANDSGNVPSC